jgi:hypothetical protein
LLVESSNTIKHEEIAMPENKISNRFLDYFADLEDPRRYYGNKLHELSDVLVLTILAVISGAESWVDVEEFGINKEEWLKTFLKLPNGIPSHDARPSAK